MDSAIQTKYCWNVYSIYYITERYPNIGIVLIFYEMNTEMKIWKSFLQVK